jgi:hypothetical protein
MNCSRLLVDRLAILVVVRRFHGMSAADSRSLRSKNYVRMQHFVRRFTYVPFRRFLGDVLSEFMQRLSFALHGTLGSYHRRTARLFMRAMLMLWHAVLFLGLRFFPLFFFCLVASTALSCKTSFFKLQQAEIRLPRPEA